MWKGAPRQFILYPKQVHLWKATIPTYQSEQEFFLEFLSADEKERASKFRFEKDKATYILGKGLLRFLLGKYLSCTPSSIQFEYNEQAKPFYQNALNIQFNVSHSHEVVVFAFTLQHDIGIDVEYNQRPIEIETIARRFFSAQETNTLLRLPESEWLSTFYKCWTRKEAFIKAKGGGLSVPLHQFEVSLVSEKAARLEKICWDPKDVVHWKMEAFHCGEEYTGACIVNRNHSSFEYYDGDSLKAILKQDL